MHSNKTSLVELEERVRLLERAISAKGTVLQIAHVYPTFICVKCGVYVFLDPDVYRNIQNAPVCCKKCNTLHILTIERGELKKIESK
jgi:hypothetical protein